MTRKYDLHSHSTASDGTLSPAELVHAASSAGVDVLALTDHDTTDGVAEALESAQATGLSLIPGVEISVSWQSHTIHLLGLNIRPECEALQAGLVKLQGFRDWRAGEIGRRLEKAGIHGGFDGACALARGRIVSRTHFAHYLVARGYGRSVRDIFKHYLVNNKPGFVPGEWASMEEALDWIGAAGGIAVIAHPARYRMTASKLRRLIGEFREMSGLGMEVVSGSHSRDNVINMARVCRNEGLLASCGSDYHGPENPWVKLGQLTSLPAGCQAVWQSRAWRL